MSFAGCSCWVADVGQWLRYELQAVYENILGVQWLSELD